MALLQPFLSEASKRALTEAVKAVEAQSCVEVCIAVRPRSAGYWHAPLIVAVLTLVIAQAFMLFSHYEFSVTAIFIDPIVAALIVGIASAVILPLRRALTPRAVRDREVARMAHALFYEQGIRMTRDRIGILVFFSLLERRMEIVADVGVLAALTESEWQKAKEHVQNVFEGGGSAQEVADALKTWGAICEPALPRSEDDINELPDEVAA